MRQRRGRERPLARQPAQGHGEQPLGPAFVGDEGRGRGGSHGLGVVVQAGDQPGGRFLAATHPGQGPELVDREHPQLRAGGFDQFDHGPARVRMTPPKPGHSRHPGRTG